MSLRTENHHANDDTRASKVSITLPTVLQGDLFAQKGLLNLNFLLLLVFLIHDPACLMLQTATLICELFPEKICVGLDEGLQKNLISSLEIGLTGVGVGASDTVFILCCDFLQVICSYLYRTKQFQLPIFSALRPFVKVSDSLQLICTV